MKKSFFLYQRTRRKYYLFGSGVVIILFFGENSSLAFSIFAEIKTEKRKKCQ